MKRVTQVFVAVSLVVLSFALAACAAATATPTPTATPTRPAPTPTPTPSGTQYPVSLTDMAGRAVQLSALPARIVTLSPTATEFLYRVGGTAVGRDSSSKYPPEAQSVAAVGSAYNPSIESITALKPDLIIIEGITQAQLIQPLTPVGAPVLVVKATSVDDVAKSLALVGKAVNKDKEAAQAAADIKQRVEAQKGQVKTPVKVLVLISDANRNVYAAKPESYPGAVLTALGLTNPAAGLPDSGPYPGFAQVSGEQAVTFNPDVIFTISPAPAPAPKLSEVLPNVPGYNSLNAVKTGKVKEISPELFLQAQGPRIADAVEQASGLVKDAMK